MAVLALDLRMANMAVSCAHIGNNPLAFAPGEYTFVSILHISDGQITRLRACP